MSKRLNYSITEASVLRQAGWWASAVDQTIREALRDRANGADPDSFAGAVGRMLAFGDTAYIKRRIDELEMSGEVVRANQRVHLAETTRRAMAEATDRRRAVLREVEQHYEQLRRTVAGGQACPGWAEFEKEILNPLITELGAHTVELFNGQPTVTSRPALEKYFAGTETNRTALREVGLSFFDPENEYVRQHVFAELQSYFWAASRALDKESLAQLTKTANPEFNLLLDTNAVFSILNLHHNPANEATRYLLDLREGVSEYARVQFFVLQDTLDEARSALDRARQECSLAIRTSAQAKSLHDDPHANGLIDRYAEIARESPITAETYFLEISTYLEVACAGIGVQVLDDPTHKEGVDFRARVNDWVSWQEGRRNPRTRGAITHDLRCLTFVKSKRPSQNVSIVADAAWWLLTIDHRLRSFEKSNLAGNRILPCAIGPDELTQVLNFWSPRPEELEEAMIVGMRLPFASYDHDNSTQRTSLEILQNLNKFAGADELSAESTRRILVDKAVREVFVNEDASPEQRQAAIESVALRELKNAEAERDALNAQLRDVAQAVPQAKATKPRQEEVSAGMERSKRELLAKVDASQRENKKLLERLNREAARHRDEQERLQGEIKSLRDLAATEGSVRRLGDRLPLIVAIIIGILVAATCIFLTKHFFWDLPGRWFRLACAAVVGSALGMAIVPTLAKAFGVRSEWGILSYCRKHRRAVWVTVGVTLFGAVLQFAIAPPESEPAAPLTPTSTTSQ